MKQRAERIPGTVFYTEQHSKPARAMRLWGVEGSLSDEAAETATHQKMERVCVVFICFSSSEGSKDSLNYLAQK